MLVKLNLTVKCKLCSNKDDRKFYIMPKEEKVKDGIHFSTTEYRLVCKLCGNSHNLSVNLE